MAWLMFWHDWCFSKVDVLIDIEWPHFILSVILNEQIRYLSLSKIKSVYIFLQFQRKYKLSEIFTWVGKFVILCVQVLFVHPHTTLHTPNSRYIFQDFECCMKCVALNESDITQSIELPKFRPTSILAKWKSILCKKRKWTH